MKLSIGTIKSDRKGFETLAEVFKTARDLSLDTLNLDFSSCSFFEGNMAAPFYAILSQVFNGLNEISVVNVPDDVEKILRKNQFFCVFGYTAIHDHNQTTLPFKKFKLQAGDQFSDYLDQYLKGKGLPEMTYALTKKFRQSLLEIFQNSAIHSDSASGIFTCGQFFPKKQRIDFTIADAGIGIRENVRRYHGDAKISSRDAIRWGLTEGNTTRKGGNQPGGLGLKLIKDFIRLNQGKIQIISRFGFYQYSASGELLLKMDKDFPGTSVNIEINTGDTNSYRLKSELKVDDIF